MSAETDHESWLRRPKTLLAVLVVARLVLETAGAAHTWTRYLSSTVALFLAAIYLGAVAPLRGVTRFTKLILPAIFLTVWTAGWVIFAILVSAILQLHGSHFAAPEDYGNWSHLRQHIIGHVGLIGIYSAVVLVLMAVPFVLRHWPVAVGPAAVLGALVITRYWVEAMGLGSSYASAWSSTVAMLLCGFYLGGVGPCFGLKLSGQLLIPSVLLGWAWRFWVFLAAVLSVVAPFYKTHFFDPSGGRVALRLATSLGFGALEGFVYGIVAWGIAVWISHATRRTVEA